MPPMPFKPILLNRSAPTKLDRPPSQSIASQKLDAKIAYQSKRRPPPVPQLLSSKHYRRPAAYGNENKADCSFVKKTSRGGARKTDQNALFLSNRNNSIAGELMQVERKSPLNQYSLTSTHRDEKNRKQRFLREEKVEKTLKLSMISDSEKEVPPTSQEGIPQKVIQRNCSRLQIISECSEPRPAKTENVLRKNLAFLSGRASPMTDPRRTKMDLGFLNSSSNYATPIAECVRPATEINTPVHTFTNFKLYRQNSDMNTSIDFDPQSSSGFSRSPVNTSLKLEFSTQADPKQLNALQQPLEVPRSQSVQSCYALESGGSICEFGEVNRPTPTASSGYSRPTASFRNKKIEQHQHKQHKIKKVISRKTGAYNSGGYSLSQSDIEALKEISNQVNQELVGVPLERIKERIDEQVSGVFVSGGTKRRKNSLLFSRNCLISKGSSEDIGRSEDFAYRKDTSMQQEKRRPPVPILKLERRKTASIEAKGTSKTDREKKKPKRIETTAFKTNNKVITATHTSRRIKSDQFPKMRSSAIGLQKPPRRPKTPPPVLLSDSERGLYGDRCPKGYKKIKLLGKGGCAVVWLAKKEDEQTNEMCAIKQFPTGRKVSPAILESCKNELRIGHLLNDTEHFSNLGLECIARLKDVNQESRQDQWLMYELGGTPLTKMLYELKGEFINGERIYNVLHQPLYNQFKSNINSFKQLLRLLLRALAATSQRNIVHADIKPDNILIDFKDNAIQGVKLIDFGSSYLYSHPPRSLALGTPEYMPPQAFQYEASQQPISDLCAHSEPWSYDIWALGCLWLQMATGFPLWLSLKAKIQVENDYSVFGTGFFAVPGREHNKIYQKQMGMLKLGIPECSQRFFEGLAWMRQEEAAVDLLSQMLRANPRERISPLKALQHRFLKQEGKYGKPPRSGELKYC